MNRFCDPLTKHLVFAGVLLAFLGHSSGQEGPGMGLVFATPEQLREIPVAPPPYGAGKLPASVDLSGVMPPPGQQGRQNSCVGWTVAYALKSYHEHKEEGTPLVAGSQPNPQGVFSPAFIYNKINRGIDAGSNFQAAFKVLSEQGCAKWSEMPYQPDDFRRQPTADASARAKRYKIDLVHQVNIRDVIEVKSHLHQELPVMVGLNVHQNLEPYRGGIYREAGQVVGRHATIVVGYDDNRSAFKIMNSWGQEWGEGGFGWIHYDSFVRIVNEGYIAMDAPNGGGPLVRDVVPNDPDKTLPPAQVHPEPPSPSTPVAVRVLNVQHNVLSPGRPDLGVGMNITGTVEIPRGRPGNLQVVLPVFQARNPDGTGVGNPVPSTSPFFATIHGQAATSPGVIQVGQDGFASPWQAFLPYGTINLPAGFQVGQNFPFRHLLVVQPIVYLNQFGIGQGEVAPFFLDR
jgi:hypothetical protein